MIFFFRKYTRQSSWTCGSMRKLQSTGKVPTNSSVCGSNLGIGNPQSKALPTGANIYIVMLVLI